MRITLVSPYSLDLPGGVQTHVVELAQRLAHAGEAVTVVAPGTEQASGPYRHIAVGSAIGVPANGAVAPIALDPRVVGRVAGAISDADVVHIHEPLMPLVGWSALRHSSRVLTFHADPSRLIRRVYAVCAPALRKATDGAAVTAVSELAASALRPFAPAPLIVPNGLDTGRYDLGLNRVRGRVTFLGRNDPRKGLDVLRAAWPEIRRRVPDATLVVLGAEGEDRDGVVYLGRVDEPTKAHELARSEVFCAPNRGGESFGITLVEGLAAGNAVVASDLPAFRAVAGPSAVYAPVGDRGSLAAAVSDLLADPSEIARLRQEGMARAQRYDWSQIVPRYRQIYEQVTSTQQK
jgi:phosphatidylinositol alpha-mannosyltransferase